MEGYLVGLNLRAHHLDEPLGSPLLATVGEGKSKKRFYATDKTLVILGTLIDPINDELDLGCL